jgi:hypothetical protein
LSCTSFGLTTGVAAFPATGMDPSDAFSKNGRGNSE